MAELVTAPTLLEVIQSESEVRVARENSFALVCRTDRPPPTITATPFGTEHCGWDGHQLFFHIDLPDGLLIRHRITRAVLDDALIIQTAVYSPEVDNPLVVNRVFNRYDPDKAGYRCTQTLTKGRVCTTEAAATAPDTLDTAAAEVLIPSIQPSLAGPLPIEVGVVVFDEGLDRFDERDARHVLRRVEARLLAVVLRDVLTQSQRWGAVRVLPAANQFAALTVTGQIEVSNGRELVLAVKAEDATGRLWLNESFRTITDEADFAGGNASQIIPFLSVFSAIQSALSATATTLSAKDIETLMRVADLRYASELAPDGFADYLGEHDGRFVLQRLPAETDPMLARIARIRNQEALFIDTVDEQYVTLQQALLPTYNLWRRSSLEQAIYLEDYTERASAREQNAERGSFAAMQQLYATYRSVRIQEQDLFELATGFSNETEPTVMRTGDRVVRLSGTLDHQYQQWRELLAQIIRLERGPLLE